MRRRSLNKRGSPPRATSSATRLASLDAPHPKRSYPAGEQCGAHSSDVINDWRARHGPNPSICTQGGEQNRFRWLSTDSNSATLTNATGTILAAGNAPPAPRFRVFVLTFSLLCRRMKILQVNDKETAKMRHQSGNMRQAVERWGWRGDGRTGGGVKAFLHQLKRNGWSEKRV